MSAGKRRSRVKGDERNKIISMENSMLIKSQQIINCFALVEEKYDNDFHHCAGRGRQSFQLLWALLDSDDFNVI